MANLKKELRAAMRDEVYDRTEEGIYFPRQGVLAAGQYHDRINGGEWQVAGDNLVVNEGLEYILNVALGGEAKPAGIYLALFNGTSTPLATWKASDFASKATELVSQAEGYSAATRQAWTPAAAVGNVIDNFGAATSLTMKSATSITVRGAALLTSNERGGTTGKLLSVSKYANSREFQEDDTYEVGYRLTLNAG